MLLIHILQSGKIKAFPKDDRKGKIKELLTADVKLEGYDHLYLPSSPFDKVVNIDYNSGTPMQSAAKCPFLLVFTVTHYAGPDASLKAIQKERESKYGGVEESKNSLKSKLLKSETSMMDVILASKPKKQACIFKVFDDCRQDVLALQVIQLMQSVYKAVGLDIPLFPYRVIATRSSTCGNAVGGIIEVVPNCDSRDGLGKKGGYSYYCLYFKFGT